MRRGISEGRLPSPLSIKSATALLAPTGRAPFMQKLTKKDIQSYERGERLLRERMNRRPIVSEERMHKLSAEIKAYEAQFKSHDDTKKSLP